MAAAVIPIAEEAGTMLPELISAGKTVLPYVIQIAGAVGPMLSKHKHKKAVVKSKNDKTGTLSVAVEHKGSGGKTVLGDTVEVPYHNVKVLDDQHQFTELLQAAIDSGVLQQAAGKVYRSKAFKQGLEKVTKMTKKQPLMLEDGVTSITPIIYAFFKTPELAAKWIPELSSLSMIVNGMEETVPRGQVGIYFHFPTTIMPVSTADIKEASARCSLLKLVVVQDTANPITVTDSPGALQILTTLHVTDGVLDSTSENTEACRVLYKTLTSHA